MDLLLSSCFYFANNAFFEEHMEKEVFKKPSSQIFKAKIYLEFEIYNIFYFKTIWVRWDKDNADDGYVQ